MKRLQAKSKEPFLIKERNMGERNNPFVSSETEEFDAGLSALLSGELELSPGSSHGQAAVGEVIEINYRESDGIVVRMLSDASYSNFWIEVDDKKLGESFVVDVPPGKNPNDYFRHPMAKERRLGSTVLRNENINTTD
jgi:hypothetical protein